MTGSCILQVVFFLTIIALCVKPLGLYMAYIYEDQPCGINRVFQPLEKLIYRVCGVHVEQEMNWIQYLVSMLVFNILCILIVYILLRLQAYMPLNPQHFPGIPPYLALNTAVSFVTNTDWQAYSGETTMSYFSQMFVLTVQNFASAATGMALLIAFIRSLTRYGTNSLGNFWVDTVRGALYILLPLAVIFAVALSATGVIQNFKPNQVATLVQPITYQQNTVTQQSLAMGPVASQVAIKQLGTNGGGFFNTNSAHPFENPNGISNFLEMLAIILIPFCLCYTYGVLVKDLSQGYSILIAMITLLVPLIFFANYAEQSGNPAFNNMGINQVYMDKLTSGGNMEGKEVRFGTVDSALWATLTTATSNGSVNSMHDSFLPLGGLVPLWLMHLGEIVFGGEGSGLYVMLIVVILTVFVSGLMVGRTPEYLGKKIDLFEIKMASLAVLIMPLVVIFFTALSVMLKVGLESIRNPGAHGLSEVLYAFTSMANNNGSAFAGLNANTPYYNLLGVVGLLIGRYWVVIPIMAIAGSLVKKKLIPPSAGTLPTNTPLFIVLLILIAIILGALTFFPALALGPIVEHVMLWGKYGN